jgi:hypothetical protein
MPLKVNHQITVADAHKSKNKIKLLFIVPGHFVVKSITVPLSLETAVEKSYFLKWIFQIHNS